MPSENWFALQIYTGKERWTAAELEERGYDVLLLLYSIQRQWSDRKVTIERPLFPGYLFCRFEQALRVKVAAVPGVLQVIGSGKTPIPVGEHEIRSLQKIAEAGWPASPCPYVNSGDLVEVAGGALDGVVGRVVSVRRKLRVVVSVSILERSVSVEVDQTRLRVVEPVAGSRHQGHVLPQSMLAGVEEALVAPVHCFRSGRQRRLAI
jgi:transcription antitermination factor NusG